VNVVYADPPCINCAVTDGTPVYWYSGANFALDVGGRISGDVTDALTGKPLSQVLVDIFDSEGARVIGALTNGAGHYATHGLPRGTYFAVASKRQYAAVLYAGHSCIGCNVTDGTPISVIDPETATDVGFELVAFVGSGDAKLNRAVGTPLKDFERTDPDPLMAVMATRRSLVRTLPIAVRGFRGACNGAPPGVVVGNPAPRTANTTPSSKGYATVESFGGMRSTPKCVELSQGVPVPGGMN